jgi:hypothetical protein
MAYEVGKCYHNSYQFLGYLDTGGKKRILEKIGGLKMKTIETIRGKRWAFSPCMFWHEFCFILN